MSPIAVCEAQINNVRIHNRASAAEVQQLYKLGTVILRPN
jgi:hypothetical protein